MAVVTSKDNWPKITQASNAKKGPLVRVQIGRAVCKMYEADAIAQGLIPGKAKPQAANKMLQPPANKTAGAEAQSEEKAPADDFTTIPGIGPATARSLIAHGIITFEQLRNATDLAFLMGKAKEALKAWSQNHG